jgi:hypothetical protein
MFKNSKEILDYIKKEDVKLIDIRFIDLPGIQHHFNVPAGSFDESVFTDGLMFDGSSIRGFQSIHESDMKLLPIPSSAYLDPYRKEKTLIILFSVHNPIDNSPELQIKHSSLQKQSFTSLMRFVLRLICTSRITILILMKAGGIAAKSLMQMAHHLAAIAHESRVDISQFHQLINTQTFAMKS